MLIRINKSRLFDTNPSIRFAEQYNVVDNMWTEMWKRYKLLGYSIEELSDYFTFKVGKKIRRRQLKKWIFLTEVYIITKPAKDMGCEVVSTEIFGVLEEKVINEITKHLKSGSTYDSRIMA